MLSPEGSSSQTLDNNNLIHSIFSYNNVMLAAVVCLLLVILFVLFLHVYAKWFLAQARNRNNDNNRRRRRRRSFSAVENSLPNTITHNLDNDVVPDKGLDPRVIASIPLFVVYDGNNEGEEYGKQMECVICISALDEGDLGRRLPACSHAFHVECVDKWLRCHSSCPLCRTPVIAAGKDNNDDEGLRQEEEEVRNHSSNTSVEIVVEVPNPPNSVDNEVIKNDSLSASLRRILSSGSGSSRSSGRKIHPSNQPTQPDDLSHLQNHPQTLNFV